MDTVAILIVGDEILSGEIVDENGPFLLRVLTEAGVDVVRVVTVGDQQHEIAGELRRLRAFADAVVVSGGIGPTHDDPTRPAIAEALGVDLETNAEAEARVRSFYREDTTAAELGMAEMPHGAQLLHGKKTGTFGFSVRGVYALPGVPFLFRDLACALPEAFATRPIYRAVLETTCREGVIAPRLSDIQDASPDVAIGSYPIYDAECRRWHVRIVMRAPDPDRLAEVETAVRTALEESR